MLSLKVSAIQQKLLDWKGEGKKIFITSSFQSHSLPLLHICTQAIPDMPVFFIDTNFHFPETYAFRNKIVKDWNLNLKNVKSPIALNQQKDENGTFLYNTDIDQCCNINKVEPLSNEVLNYDLWIAGLRRDQTKFRSGLNELEPLESGVLKYHPILEWNSKMIFEYQKEHNLPPHPLEEFGYFSIGCLPCTKSVYEDSERGRWAGSNKTECGIHLK